ncbi:hypothetical protein C2G38_2150334 [Gigaspora rosea]|uniref:Uncharacterized protein n=1 Tax=Gigaspora rosea TaxID=44941 RepID=A0A397TZ16_9GLOM|nr:hypothetical protein C2G38_2150334 [Gigaspora rosea]
MPGHNHEIEITNSQYLNKQSNNTPKDQECQGNKHPSTSPAHRFLDNQIQSNIAKVSINRILRKPSTGSWLLQSFGSQNRTNSTLVGSQLVRWTKTYRNTAQQAKPSYVLMESCHMHEIAYKSIKQFLKSNEEDYMLVTIESRTIAIRKRSCTTKFADIAKWLLAFKLYVEAVLIIYDIREHKLNAYRNYINTLCINQEFSAILTYDKD